MQSFSFSCLGAVIGLVENDRHLGDMKSSNIIKWIAGVSEKRFALSLTDITCSLMTGAQRISWHSRRDRTGRLHRGGNCRYGLGCRLFGLAHVPSCTPPALITIFQNLSRPTIQTESHHVQALKLPTQELYLEDREGRIIHTSSRSGMPDAKGVSHNRLCGVSGRTQHHSGPRRVLETLSPGKPILTLLLGRSRNWTYLVFQENAIELTIEPTLRKQRTPFAISPP